jgi:hypothetical protein
MLGMGNKGRCHGSGPKDLTVQALEKSRPKTEKSKAKPMKHRQSWMSPGDWNLCLGPR